VLTGAAGHWTGTNGFRLMPADALADRPAAALVVEAAGGHLTSFAYTWEHPDDGPQEGLLVFGPAESDEAGVVALWGDSWHQQPAPRPFAGRRAGDGAVELSAEYGGGWAWQIAVQVDGDDADSLTLVMRNVIPADQATADEQAGPYVVMQMELRRG
jgi:hypothetical protein